MGTPYLHRFEKHAGVCAQLLGVPDDIFINCKAHVLEDESILFCGNTDRNGETEADTREQGEGY